MDAKGLYHRFINMDRVDLYQVLRDYLNESAEKN